MADRFVQWLRHHDPGYVALRRAGRTAIVMPAVFAISIEVLDNATVALFAAFGAIALLMLVEFGGRMRNRLEAQAALSIAGGVLICLGTFASHAVWSAVLAMLIVAFVVIFLGVVSSVFAIATTALLLAFILPAATTAPVSAIPDRLAGWGIASGAAMLAIWLLWPAPARSPLRTNSVAACRALAARLSSDIQRLENGEVPGSPPSDQPEPADPVNALQRQFLTTPWRPTGLSGSDRALVRLVDEIVWMNTMVTELDHDTRPSSLRGLSLAVQRASVSVLTEAATLLETRAAPLTPLATARNQLDVAMREMERHLEHHLSMADHHAEPSTPPSNDNLVERFLASLAFSFRSREIGYATQRIATDVEHAITAERRDFFDRVLGHEPGGTSPWSSARARITSHLQRHSVWLHNSVRGAIGLTIAILVVEEIAVEHSFWVILGTLSVLRSNALNTGQNALRAVIGTVVGFILGAIVVELTGTNVTLLWFLLPLALFVAAFMPTAVSFAAGQAGFTLAIVILFNIIEPAGWRVGLVRLEDIAIGCAVSAGVALLLWPRGAAAELGAAMHDAYVTGVAFLATATSATSADGGTSRQLASTTASDAERAAAASRRLDDAFRTYIAERGAKPVPLSDVATLVTGVAILRLSADAIDDLWDHVGIDDRWRAARERLDGVAEATVTWYDEFADSFEGTSGRRELTPQSIPDDSVVSAVRDQLARPDEANLDEVVRILWTAGHLTVVQNLETNVIDASRVAGALWNPPSAPGRGGRRKAPRRVA
jgi:uncharacterized membrane protein YccC